MGAAARPHQIRCFWPPGPGQTSSNSLFLATWPWPDLIKFVGFWPNSGSSMGAAERPHQIRCFWPLGPGQTSSNSLFLAKFGFQHRCGGQTSSNSVVFGQIRVPVSARRPDLIKFVVFGHLALARPQQIRGFWPNSGSSIGAAARPHQISCFWPPGPGQTSSNSWFLATWPWPDLSKFVVFGQIRVPASARRPDLIKFVVFGQQIGPGQTSANSWFLAKFGFQYRRGGQTSSNSWFLATWPWPDLIKFVVFGQIRVPASARRPDLIKFVVFGQLGPGQTSAIFF